MSDKLRYVLLLAIDPAGQNVVGITKLRGPSFLLKKVSFPGGKIEGSESVFEAAERELKEEAGIEVPAHQWQVYSSSIHEDYELTKLVAVTDKVLHARTMEEEPVWLLDIEAHLRYARNQPQQYAPDFIRTLERALAFLESAGKDSCVQLRPAA